ncbi:MAG: thioredoxin family protein [Proteobacteria bacterium]|nr:thioredoxin family protein [Pseudomonadota bacterium]MBU4289363.1 thioredoxin family protein [Pseudomonadota bacterium]MBU4414684.1 thioredoxin family protein [Pseudomonadota bacterium]MCG2757653.1 thioredoxin family protein [Desulfobacteraceae bacterium]
MKTIFKYTCFLTIIIVILSTLSFSFASSKYIRWYTYKQGIELNKKEGEKIFLYFYTDLCAYCKKMEKETFNDYSVVSYLNENFIPIKVNSDREIKIALDFGIRGVPSTCFIAENGERISSLLGYIPPKRLLNILKYINTDSFKKMDFRKFMEL